MTSIILGILLVVCGILICGRRDWVAEKLQRFYSTYPVARLAGKDEQRSRGGFIVAFGVLLAGIGVAAIASRLAS